MVSALLSRCLILVLGTLYPAYRSYKAIKNKDLREHVKWMMYWIVFALFTTLETFLDIFLSWFPFYYEIKIIFILWVLSPATRGSSILYKKLVHPMLISREQEIDELIEKTKVQGYSTFIQLFTSGFNYLSNLFMNSAMRGQSFLGAHITQSLSVNQIYKEQGNAQQIRSSKSNDGYFLQAQNGLIDDDEEEPDSSDMEREMRRRQVTKVAKKSRHTNNNYDLLDDVEILSNDQIEDIHRKTSLSTKNIAPKQRKVTKTTSAEQTMNQRTNEASHYGTLTRGKTSKSRTVVTRDTNDSDQ